MFGNWGNVVPPMCFFPMNTSSYITFRVCLLLSGIALWLLQTFFPLSSSLQWRIFMVTVLTIGIPHGAIDHLVEERNRHADKKRFLIGIFLVRYIALLFLFVLLWQAPVFAFIFFILISAYHFGETDLYDIEGKLFLKNILFLKYGLLIIAFMICSHLQEVIPLLEIMGFDIKPEVKAFAFSGYASTVVRIIAISAFFITSLVNAFLIKKSPFTLARLVEVLLNVFLVASLPLLLAFTYYFGIWHSLLSLRNMHAHLKADGIKYKKFWKQALLLSLTALAFIAAAGFMLRQMNSADGVTGTIFIGLAVLTLPHMQVMHHMYLHMQQKLYSS